MSKAKTKAKIPGEMTEAQLDNSAIRAGLFKLASSLAKAKGVGGPALVLLLKEISEEVYEAGIDRVFKETKLKNMDNCADSFDFTWLTILIVRLNQRKKS